MSVPAIWLEQRPGEVVRRAVARTAVGELAGIGLGMGDEFACVAGAG